MWQKGRRVTTNFQISEFLCKCCGAGADIVKQELLDKLQVIRNEYGIPMVVDCGYRCPSHNVAIGAPDSAHLTGEAADILDVTGKLKDFCRSEKLEVWGLWAEAYESTPTWVHLQIRPAVNRIFKP